VQETEPKKTFQKTTRQQWRELVIDLDVMPTIRLVLLRVSQGANAEGHHALAGVEYLMDKLHITRSTITRALAYGRRQGLLTRGVRGKKDVGVSSYSLTFPNWFVREDPVEDEELFF
jgi:hypothetical protein